MATSSDSLTITLVGSDEDAGHIRLSALLDELAAIQETLRHTERVLTGQRQSLLHYQVVGLRHSSPVAVDLKAVAPVSANVSIQPGEVVRHFTDNLDKLTQGQLPMRLPVKALEAYSKLGATTGRHVKRISVSTIRKLGHETDSNHNEPRTVVFDQSIGKVVQRLIGSKVTSPGSIAGYLDEINVHSEFTCLIYPRSGPQRVRCKFKQAHLGDITAGLGKFVTVTGILVYKKRGQYPHEVRVENVTVHTNSGGRRLLNELHGIAPGATGGLSSAEFVRRQRDEDW